MYGNDHGTYSLQLACSYSVMARNTYCILLGITVAILHCRRCNPFVRRFHGFQNAISVGKEHNKQALFASGRDSPSSGDDGSSSPDGPPVLTIVAGVIVILLVLWVIGSIATWIVGLVFGAAKS
jgi:hypothetical protein